MPFFALIIATFVAHQRILFFITLALGFAYTTFFFVRNYRRLYQFNERNDKNQTLIKRAQNTARYFESILQDSSDIIFTLDADSNILKFNRGAEIHFGWSQVEIVGKEFEKLFVNYEDADKVLKIVQNEGKLVNKEVSMKTKGGTVLIVHLSISQMKNDNSKLTGFVVTARDITEKRKLEMELLSSNEKLNKLATTDSLTGLFNARHFYEQLKRELQRFNRKPDLNLTLVMIDIDHFKQLNDSEGHLSGDHTLKSLAVAIKTNIRDQIDTAYRYGGDEFILILPFTTSNEALTVTNRIQGQYNSYKFGTTGLSMGVAQVRANENEQSVMKRADDALYQSKREGRGRTTLAP